MLNADCAEKFGYAEYEWYLLTGYSQETFTRTDTFQAMQKASFLLYITLLIQSSVEDTSQSRSMFDNHSLFYCEIRILVDWKSISTNKVIITQKKP